MWNKKSKYRSKKVVIDNHKFDSKKEANYYLQLKLLLDAGKIEALDLQPKFLLQPAFTKHGKTYRKIEYIADFSYYENGKRVIVDVKGFKTETYKLKKKLFEFKFKELTLIEV
jgi:hypothetical protein